MSLRDEIEEIIRAWNRHERDRGGAPVIDFDCVPEDDSHPDPADRLTVLRRLLQARKEIGNDDAGAVLKRRLDADLAYLRALMGERTPLNEYLAATQGCSAAGWPGEYIEAKGEDVQKLLRDVGVPWDKNAIAGLEATEGSIATEDVGDAIVEAARSAESSARTLAGTDTQYDLTVELDAVDAYWSYWLDGSGRKARLRINRRRAQFTEVLVRQFALHEVLGHALQSASIAARCADEDVPWVRLFSVHTGYSVISEGMAQAMPLFLTPDDQSVITRVHLAHYLQLVRAEVHLAINSGATVEQCALHARTRVPFWGDDEIADILTDRSVNPQLRSYLWSYPAGIDWFVALAGAGSQVVQEVFRAAYQRPLHPADLAALWPAGPPIGGSGRPVRLRQPDVPRGATSPPGSRP